MMSDTNTIALKDYEMPFNRYVVCCNEPEISGVAGTGYYDNKADIWRPCQDEAVFLGESEAIEFAMRLQNRFARIQDAIFICKIEVRMKRVAIKLEEV